MKYNKQFYSGQQDGSYNSAKIIVPIIIEKLKPKSVVDVGCGVGTFLKVFMKKGVKEVWGLDGAWVNENLLKIPKKHFQVVDLTRSFSVDHKFDLAISLEVAEHLPKESAEDFVESLTKLSDYIVFSAAIPGQGGTGHLNEQWPDYWAAIFEKYNYLPSDTIRSEIWNNDTVEPWYQQNILLFVKKNLAYVHGSKEYNLYKNSLKRLSIVHPRMYMQNVNRINRIKKFLPMGFINWTRRLLK